MEVIISIISLLVIVIVTVVLLYQNASVRDNTTAKMQTMVDKINDANYYTFQYDKKQEHNIKTLDDNINTVAGDVRNVYGELQAFKPTVVPRKELAESVSTKQLNTNDLTLQGQYMFKHDNQGNWLRLNGNDGKFKDGWAMDKLHVENNALVNGNLTTSQLVVGDSLNIKGGTSSFNPNNTRTQFAGSNNLNYIAGDTEVIGTLKSKGKFETERGIDAYDTIKVEKTNYGMFLENRNKANNVAMGLGNYKNNEFRMMNESANGQITLGLGKDDKFDALTTMSKTDTDKTVTLGGDKGLRVINNKLNDVVLRTEAKTNTLALQTGDKQGVRIKDGMVTIGNSENITATKMDVYGNVLVRGNEMRLGYSNLAGGNTAESRAMVKHDSELIFNFNNDFPQGSTFHSDLNVINGKCIEVGKGAANKEAAAGKICYAKYSDGVDIVGGGKSNSERSVRVWDRLETNEVQTKNKLCIGNTCISEDDLKRFKNVITTNGVCLNNTCLLENDIQRIKQMFGTS